MSNQTRMLELRQALSRVIVGQDVLLDRLVIGLLADGHVLVEGLPGLAKTTAVKTLAAASSPCGRPRDRVAMNSWRLPNKRGLRPFYRASSSQETPPV
ncbi:hypothetical protein [Thiobacillus sp.]|uniref:AAA family ATPase n=1 Tax=Thiobacillus sp. TaxID=924 RepID=UPI0025EDA16F|nr:hypothetical protein [Thiobacillus sp.]